ncbi:TMEM245 [Cordylochernes scorpioides]|uniref:TMEM245 n=1 Tax=Cordylochernes scorpioides TaxID=51811 RepID=A0ABY6KPI8_9ARAC|nr:TMEM245 [Cordylochernes scorpioides]
MSLYSMGHPYLTGLAIAGGIFCFGVEGALFGPLLLCFFCVLVNLYSGIVQDMPLDDTGRRSSRHLFRRYSSMVD